MNFFKKFLIALGHPIYLTIAYTIILFSITFEYLNKFLNTPLPKPRLPKIKTSLPTFKISPPKIHVPKIKIPLPKLHTPKIVITTKIKIFVICSFAFVICIFLSWFFLLKNLPSPSELSTRNIDISTKIYDRNGELLYKIYKDQNRSVISLEDVPLHVQLATLAAEDADFYNHPGFSVKGIIRSIYKYIKSDKVEGGSTITQQLVKNALLTPERTITRKLREIILAVLVEQKYSKDQILEMYLNEVPYGGTTYGIEEASQYYFGKSVKDLDIAEAALLAGLPKSPTKLSPFGHSPEDTLSRQKEVLDQMQAHGFITPELAQSAKNEKLVFATNQTPIKAPHFVMYVRNILVDMFGEEVVDRGGLNVTTTLDLNIQNLAQETVTSEVNKIRNLNVTNGAALVINPQTGEVLAMVGSVNYFDTKNDGNVNVTLRLRQPGSSIKVINYAYALAHGYTPATIISDTPITFTISGSPPYTPKNYDGVFKGNITLRNAFAQSRNIPAVRVLSTYGVSKMVELGKQMGITTWNNPQNYGLSLTLGGADVRLLDLAQVYATVANQGARPDITSIKKVTNYKGDVLFKNKPKTPNQVIDPRVAFLITNILNDNSARSPAFGSRSALVIPNYPEVAVKTGTSNNLKDNLAIGYNQNYLVATWVGNNNSTPMSRVASGITGASPIWNKIMTSLLASSPSINWGVPNNLVNISICSITGTLPCQGCPSRQEWFLKENQPQVSCNPEYLKKPPQLLPEAASTSQNPKPQN